MPARRRLTDEAGTTLIETAIAVGILLVTLAGLMSVGALATMHTENQGHLAPRTSEYAQDKMEQLLALAYTDATTRHRRLSARRYRRHRPGDRRQREPEHAGQRVRRLARATTAAISGGGTTPPSSWFYERVWQITAPSTGMKQLTVSVKVRSSVGKFMLRAIDHRRP